MNKNQNWDSYKIRVLYPLMSIFTNSNSNIFVSNFYVFTLPIKIDRYG